SGALGQLGDDVELGLAQLHPVRAVVFPGRTGSREIELRRCLRADGVPDRAVERVGYFLCRDEHGRIVFAPRLEAVTDLGIESVDQKRVPDLVEQKQQAAAIDQLAGVME